MRLFLESGVHAVGVGEDLVFLDTSSDAYFCLAGAAEVMVLGPRGQVEVSQAEAAQQLLEVGLLARRRAQGAVLTPPRPRASTRLVGAATRPLSAGLVLEAITVTLGVARRFSKYSFGGLLAGPAPNAMALEDPSPVLTQAVAEFEKLRPWLPLQGECLLRSYYLRSFLRARGLDAMWVFGVRTWPFDAHCWLQAGATVLDEDLERLSAYHPIMAV